MTNTHWHSVKDKYGRKVYELSSIGARVDAVVIVLPKSFVEAYPDQGRYLVGFRLLPLEWDDEGRIVAHPLHEVYRETLRGAMAFAEAMVAELRAIPGNLSLATRDQLLVARQDAERDVRVAEGTLATLDRMGVEEDSRARDESTDQLAHAMHRVFLIRGELLRRPLPTREEVTV